MWFALTQPPYGTSIPQSGRRPQHQSRHVDRAPLTSGFPQIADILRVIRHVSKVPKNETARAVGAAAWGAGVPAMDGRWERVA
jgi:hypothetical protein